MSICSVSSYAQVLHVDYLVLRAILLESTITDEDPGVQRS